MMKRVGHILWVVLIGGVSILVGYTFALHQKTADTYRLEDHKLYAEDVERRLTRLSDLQEEFMRRQSVNRDNIAINSAAIDRNSQRMEMLCAALLKRACVP